MFQKSFLLGQGLGFRVFMSFLKL